MERTRGAIVVPSEGLTEGDVRLQLEGRLEQVESANAQLSRIKALLSGFRWKRALRGDPNALSEAVKALAPFDEAAERINRRAQSAGWPEDNSFQRVVQDTSRLRSDVDALARKRLGRLKSGMESAPLSDVLLKLEKLATAPLPVEPNAGEQRLFEGRLGETTAISMWPFLVYAPAFLSSLIQWPYFVPAAYGVLMAFLLFTLARSGRFWVTTERLVWKPFFGEPVEVSLRSITQVQLKAFSGTVHVRGSRDVAVRHVESAAKLASVLEARRLPPLRDASTTQQVSEVVLYKGRLERPGTTGAGVVVVRPDFAAFIPEEKGAAMLAAIRGEAQAPSLAIDPLLLVEQLRCLPESQFDDALRAATQAVGGVVLPRAQARRDVQSPPWRDIVLRGEGGTLHGNVDWRQLEVAERILRRWHG